MATVKIILDKRKAKPDGSYPIYFQICHNRKTTTRSIKIYVNEKDWDDSLKIIKRSNSLHKTLNLKLQKEFADLQSQILLANDVQVQKILKPELVPSQTPKLKKSVYVFGQELVNQLKADNKTGNAWVYEASINALKGFHPDEDLFLYVTDGAGSFVAENGREQGTLGQYDVILARPDVETVTVKAGTGRPLDFLSFYLPRFLS